MNTLFARIRQWRYAREFRIASPLWPQELQAKLERIMLLLTEAQKAPPATGETGPGQLRLLADVATGIWRLKQRMVEPGSERPLEEMRRAFRHLQSVWDALHQAGVEIIDHTGKAFDSGLSIKVIAFQPTPEVTREKVLETIKPTVFFGNRSIQMGEVIVATPEKPATQA